MCPGRFGRSRLVSGGARAARVTAWLAAAQAAPTTNRPAARPKLAATNAQTRRTQRRTQLAAQRAPGPRFAPRFPRPEPPQASLSTSSARCWPSTHPELVIDALVVEHRHDVAERRRMRRDGFPGFTQLVERPDAFRGLGRIVAALGAHCSSTGSPRRCRWPPRPRRPAQGARRGW